MTRPSYSEGMGGAARPADGRRPVVVLLVDDQQFVGTAVRMLLAQETDVELHCCEQALEAVAMANRIAPTVILQDLVMPEVDGLSLMRLYRTNPTTAGTPVIVLSGNDDAATRAQALAAGAADFLVKLPAKADLIASIRRHASAPDATAGGPVEDTIDSAVMDRFDEAGAPEFTRRLIDQFIAEAGSRVQALHDAAGRDDEAALKISAHSLKGSSMIMGAKKLAVLCARIEDQLAQRPGNPVTPALFVDLGQEFVRVRDALTTRRDGGHP
jgi:CheY-like chemotaxis protein/HPt (histidine-containing phosphotransfer) domain-containing protein